MDSKQRHPLIDELVRVQTRDNLSGNELARRLNVNPSTITRLTAGDMQPSLRIVQAINASFPELRPHCVQLLMISNDSVADREQSAVAS